jgi:HEAT repeat protein
VRVQHRNARRVGTASLSWSRPVSSGVASVEQEVGMRGRGQSDRGQRARVALFTTFVALVFAGAAWSADDPEEPRPDTEEQVQKADAAAEQLDDKNKLVVNQAISNLGALKSATARDHLIAYIKKSKNAEWTTYAIRALGWKGNSGAVDYLCGKDCVRNKNVLISEASCAALATIGDKRAIPSLVEATKSGKDVTVCAAIEAVVTLDPKSPGMAELMFEHAKDKSSQVRRSVAKGFGSLEKSGPIVAQLMLFAEKDGNSFVRLEACDSLRLLKATEARELLTSMAEDDKSMEVRAAASRALLALPAPEESE